ncbi:hypothetical protein [Rhodococcus sp. IEGM 1379]|uniref:hypothetical protein n=1 Tax=Rhodococcus sp. IEGM 1379 TaxID=3047086 RepID=UPI0024B6C1A4|nr:hypothetical protein [Rhodococcus sp. IEGM 1379]MDI9914598.1 hypothetical protein [Rhodococcus sp. IEGM 1379]
MRLLAIASVASLFAVAGCTSTIPERCPVRTPAEIVEAAECAVPFTPEAVALTDRVSNLSPRPGAVPVNFHPVSAITCELQADSVVAEGPTATFYEVRWTGNPTAALEALKAPSKVLDNTTRICPFSSEASLPDLWLIDDKGRGMRASYPEDECGYNIPDGLGEVRALTESSRTARPVTLSASGLHGYTGCELDVSLPTPGLTPMDADALSVTARSICHYSIDGSEVSFVESTRAHDVVLLRGIALLEPASECSLPASRVSALSIEVRGADGVDVEKTAVVEMDGCQRVLIDRFMPLTSTPLLLSTLT